MPRLMIRQDSPPSRLAHKPPVETPTRMSVGSRGSTSTELMPGCSPPATPNHCRRSGRRHSVSFSAQVSPLSSERNSPPGIVPAHRRPGTPPLSMTQILPSDHGCGSSQASSGFGGKDGAASSRHPEAPSRRHSFAPKCPRSSAAWTACRLSLRQHRADRVAEEMHIDDVPPGIRLGAASRQFEQTLARADIKPLGHTLPLNRPSGPGTHRFRHRRQPDRRGRSGPVPARR